MVGGSEATAPEDKVRWDRDVRPICCWSRSASTGSTGPPANRRPPRPPRPAQARRRRVHRRAARFTTHHRLR